ncbi:hypothetical protein MN116_002395 [Schistosoma mekongi]|uniref:SAM domain-containing protein n=1 Tax=Schistosoma mekongi TaxID=38744 RepID=A0AAE2D8N0_SCHME|nr:hypothetical protein MN116_002395 [Schistosoma mekongi]
MSLGKPHELNLDYICCICLLDSATDDTREPTTNITTGSDSSFISVKNASSTVVCLSSSSTSFQSVVSPAQNCQSISVSNKNYSSDGHHTGVPIALATVAPLRMSSVGPDYSLSNEIIRPVKSIPQDIHTSSISSTHSTLSTATSVVLPSVSKHEVVSTTSSVSISSKPCSSQNNTNEKCSFSPICVTKPVSVSTTSVAITIAPSISSSSVNTTHISSIFNVRTRPAVAQSVLPVLSVGPQPTPSLTTPNSLSTLQTQSAVHFMPFVGNIPGALPVSSTTTGLRSVMNNNPVLPIAGTPTAPCPPLQIFNMTPMPQFVGTPSYVLHPTVPAPGSNSFQFPQGSTLLPGLSGSAGVGGATFNFLQPSQHYAPTIFPQPPNMSEVLIDSQNPMGLGHSILTPPASIALISAINNPNSSSFTSIYPTLFHPPSHNFFPTSSAHSGPVSYPYSTALAAGTNLVNATAPQMATSLVPAGVTNLPNMHNSNETNFMFQSGPSHSTSFVSNSFTPNAGHLFPSCQFPTFQNLFQTNDSCLTNALVSSGLPTDLTSSCDTKSSVGVNACMSNYWPYISSGDVNSASMVQVSSSNSQVEYLQSVNDLSNKSQMKDVTHSENSILHNFETSGTTTTNPLEHTPNISSINGTYTSVSNTNTNSTINNSNNSVNTDNHNKNSIMLPNSSTVVLPAIRRRRRLFAQNGIKPITNVIQSPTINHSTNNSMEEQSTVVNANAMNTSESNLSTNMINNSTDNITEYNNNLTCNNGLEQSSKIQSFDSLIPCSKASPTTTVLTLKNNNVQASVEDVSKQMSTDIEFVSNLSKDIQQKDSVDYDCINKLPCSSSSSSSSCNSFTNSSTATTEEISTLSSNSVKSLIVVNSSASSTIVTTSSSLMISNCQLPVDTINIPSDSHNTDDLVPLTTISSPVYKESGIMQYENKVSVEDNEKEDKTIDISHQMKSPINNSADQKNTINVDHSKLSSVTTCSNSCATYSKLKSTTSYQFPPPPVLIGPDNRRILTHYIDGHIIYESDKPFPLKDGIAVVEAALMRHQQSCIGSSTNSPLKSLIVNGYNSDNYEDGIINTVKSTSLSSPSSSIISSTIKSVDNFESELLSRPPVSAGWINPLTVSNAPSSNVDRYTNPSSSATMNLNCDVYRRKSSELCSDIHDENDSLISTNHYRPSQGILASYPHSTILSLANRNSAGVVYTQSPIVSIPCRNDRQSSDIKGNDSNVDGKSIESHSQQYLSASQHQYHETVTLVNSKPLNEIQSSSGITTELTPAVSLQPNIPQQPQRPSSIAQAMYGISQSITAPPSSLLTPTPPPKGPIYKWTPDDVVAFVRGTPGCGAYASAFLNNEIDGEALLLLAEDQFIQPPIGMKIGPALKLVARLESLKHCCC